LTCRALISAAGPASREAATTARFSVRRSSGHVRVAPSENRTESVYPPASRTARLIVSGPRQPVRTCEPMTRRPAKQPAASVNPIEKMWSKIKAFLRKAKARTWEALLAAIKAALQEVSGSDAHNWFQSCGCIQA
jgi:hypothetical protein